MIFVLFFRNGIMGDKEFSSARLVRNIVNLPATIAGKLRKKAAKEGQA